MKTTKTHGVQAGRDAMPRVLRPIFSISWLAIALTTAAQAQIQQAWIEHYNNGITNGTHQAVKMALDAAGNIYVTGFSQNTSSNFGYVTIKYAPNGNQLWASRYDSTNYPTATPVGLVLDSSNNVIVTGNALTVKYNSNGSQLWTAPYAGTALAVDSNGNSVVTGFGTSFNTVKLAPSGSNLWLQSFPSSCGAGVGQAVIADTSGNFYVSGSYPFTCDDGIVDYELLLIKYSANGSQTWKTNYEIAGVPIQVEAETLDCADNLYLVVDFEPDFNEFVTFMYSNNGTLNWVSYLVSTDGSRSYGIALDYKSNVVVTGQLTYTYNPSLSTYSYCYSTFKLDTNGNPIWTNSFPQPPFGSSVASAVAIDPANNIYITGYSPGTNGSNDIVTIKYNSNGNQVWLQRYNGPGNGNDAGNAIAVDNSGNVYVTGYDTLPGGGTEIVTIKYSALTVQRQANGTVLLQAQGSPGESFDVQASTDLQIWQDLGQSLADTNGFFQFDDTNAPQYNARFYLTLPQ